MAVLTPSAFCRCLLKRWTDPSPILKPVCGLGLDDYLHLLLQLLPRGEVWPRDPDSVQVKLMEAIAATLALPGTPGTITLEERVCRLLDELDPRALVELLGRWERWLGLPDICMPKVTGLDARRQRIVATENAVGGASPSYFIDLAALLGFDVQIEEPFPLGAGCLRGGHRAGCCCAWVVHIRCVELEDGVSLAEAQAMLECIFQRLKPAHTSVFFRYGSSFCQNSDPDRCF
jgi:uncharacterized protein YmfQ (DUF2313 family)